MTVTRRILGFLATRLDGRLSAMSFGAEESADTVREWVAEGRIVHTVLEGSPLVSVKPGDVWNGRKLEEVLAASAEAGPERT